MDEQWWARRAGLAGKVAVIPGGAGGLGAAITTDLAANGVRVAVMDRDPGARAALALVLDAHGVEHVVLDGDVRDPEALETVFAAADQRWGRLDIVVNVVGGTFRSAFADSAPRGWDALVRTNLTHVLHSCSLAIPRMRAGGRGGSIVNLTTIEAHRAAPEFAVYAAAKAAVTHFARSLAVELAPERIRVNNVAPDMTPTPAMGDLASSGSTLGDPDGVRVAVPMGRLGHPDDIAGCVVFLASDLATYITGSTLHPDGGALASSGWFNWPDEGFRNTVPAAALEAVRPRP